MAIALAPLIINSTAYTTGIAPSLGQINRYDATSAPISATLPALSSVRVGARMGIKKVDTSENTLTVLCAGSDSSTEGETSVTLQAMNEYIELQAVVDGEGKSWAIFYNAVVADWGAAGIDVARSVTQADARKALGPAVFDARDYGVVADGQEHNNVANLLDCVAACEAAGGGAIVLPAGVIVTSEASLGTVTADSGNTYTNYGAIQIPRDTPIAIVGQGSGVTTLKLSSGFPRAFDIARLEADGEEWSSIIVRGLTVDRDNMAGTDIAPRVQLAGGDSFAYSTDWQEVAVPTPSDYANVNLIYCEDEDKILDAYYDLATDKVYARNLTNSPGPVVVPAGGYISGALWGHSVIGNKRQGFMGWYGYSVTITDLLVEDVEAINLNPPGYAPDEMAREWVWGVGFTVTAHTSQAIMERLTFKNVRINGGRYGFDVTGAAGCWIDQLRFEDCFHDTELTPTGFLAMVNFIVGTFAWVGSVDVIRCEGRRSWDVALELNQPWMAREVDCRWTDSVSGVYRTCFTPPAKTSAGPPTAGSASDAAIASGATTCSVDSMPVEVDRKGWAQITSDAGREVVWYEADAADETSWTIWRGIGSTSDLNHSVGSSIVVTFIESHKTRIMSLRSEHRNGLWPNGHCYSSYNSYDYPVAPITIKEAKATITGGDLRTGSFLYQDGPCAEIEIDGARIYHTFHSTLLDEGAGWNNSVLLAPSGSIIATYSPTTNTWPSDNFPCPAPRIVGRNNVIHASGSMDDELGYAALLHRNGLVKYDLGLEVYLSVSGASACYGVQVIGGHLAADSHFDVTIRGIGSLSEQTDIYGVVVGSNTAEGELIIDIKDSDVDGEAGYTATLLNGHTAKINGIIDYADGTAGI